MDHENCPKRNFTLGNFEASYEPHKFYLTKTKDMTTPLEWEMNIY